MIKRTKILTLIFLFFISTTGLPVFYHYCEMMGVNSLSECEMCSSEEEREFSCCSEELFEDAPQIASNKSSCCIDQFDYKKIEDDFSQNFNSNTKLFNLITAVKSSTLLFNEVEKHSQQHTYDLPPPKFGKQLLYTIHQLKLDIPVC